MTGKLMNRRLSTRPACRAFTLVEILIVVMILGILAAIVVPQFTNASNQARENALRDELRFLRVQMGVYSVQHFDVAPGYPGGDPTATPTEADYIDHMTLCSDVYGNTNPTRTAVFKFGPYLSRMPRNPLSPDPSVADRVLVVANGSPLPAPDDSTGWIYKPESKEIIANLTGSDATGTPYSQY